MARRNARSARWEPMAARAMDRRMRADPTLSVLGESKFISVVTIAWYATAASRAGLLIAAS